MKFIRSVGLLVFCTHLQISIVAAESITICEHGMMKISCDRSTEIHITDASYGRQDGAETCPHPSIRHKTYDCHAESSEHVLMEACEGKSACLVDAKNGVFGDPCPGIFKYLRVSYQCIEPTLKTETVCEQTRMDIDCGDYRKIKIEGARYGRTDNSDTGSKPSYCADVIGSQRCPHPSVTSKTYDCRAESSDRVLFEACEGKSRCHVDAKNGVFGDPCPGLFKYLRVAYRCVVPPPKSKTVCEHQRMDIYCGESKKIIIESASYGRSDGETCPHVSIKTNNCHAESSERVVSDACDGKSQCHLAASNSVFGDPCGGTFKYLRVKHRCF